MLEDRGGLLLDSKGRSCISYTVALIKRRDLIEFLGTLTVDYQVEYKLGVL